MIEWKDSQDPDVLRVVAPMTFPRKEFELKVLGAMKYAWVDPHEVRYAFAKLLKDGMRGAVEACVTTNSMNRTFIPF